VSRKNPKPEKYLKSRKNPHSPLYLLLGVFVLCKTCWLKKDKIANLRKIFPIT
jgi:hypothetical protein